MCIKENRGLEEAEASVLVVFPISTCTDGERTISVQLNQSDVMLCITMA